MNIGIPAGPAGADGYRLDLAGWTFGDRIGHLLPDALDRGRTALESFDTAENGAYGPRMGASD